MPDFVAVTLKPNGTLGGLVTEDAEAPLAGATWYHAHGEGDGLTFAVALGALTRERWLSADFLLDGRDRVSFLLQLQQGDGGPTFSLQFALLNQCQARLRLPLGVADQNRWSLGREAALLKMTCGGDRVDPALVDRIRLVVNRKCERAARWCMTLPTISAAEPTPLEEPLLPVGPLVDELGQSRLLQWPGKSHDGGEVTARLEQQLAEAEAQAWPAGTSRWGGDEGRRFEASGFFRTHHDGRRWWLVDPDGCAFWSAGCDCVEVRCESSVAGLETALSWSPPKQDHRGTVWYRDGHGTEMLNYLGANLARAFGLDWPSAWKRLVLGLLRRFGFNTVGNWSRWQIAREAGFPYVRPLSYRAARTPLVFRDFPDVFHPGFAEDAAAFAAQLDETREDSALVGYFLMNEPTWGFASLTPAEGMLHNTTTCATRQALADHLRSRYAGDAGLSAAWECAVTLAEVADGPWHKPINEVARGDLAEFSSRMVTRFFGVLSEACKAADPDHLNLGVRYHRPPPEWALEGMACFDVFSLNSYTERIPAEVLGPLSERVGAPILVGEWHFGALDVGLPASGIGRVAIQADRGRAYRVYLEHAAAQPWCVGVHWFTLYDQSAVGRFDGENYQIGFVDVCCRPYEELAAAARASHEAMYRVAAGEARQFADAPEYLSRLF